MPLSFSSEGCRYAALRMAKAGLFVGAVCVGTALLGMGGYLSLVVIAIGLCQNL